MELALVGDTHGHFDAALDGPILARFDVAACTGDLAPLRHLDRFGEAMRQARDLAALGVHAIAGNHDGPTPFTGRSFPRSYERIRDALGESDLGLRRVELPEHGLALVGARPLTTGGPRIKYVPPGTEGWDHARWGEEIARLVVESRQPRVVVLAHDGPTGLGTDRAALYGKDWGREDGDWGDADLRLAIDRARSAGAPLLAVMAGHMHHALRGGGRRRRVAHDPTWPDLLHVNGAVVPRVDADGRRAVTVVTLEATTATARLEWHSTDGSIRVEPLEPPDEPAASRDAS